MKASPASSWPEGKKDLTGLCGFFMSLMTRVLMLLFLAFRISLAF